MVADFVLLADIPDDGLYFCLDDDMASVDDRCVCDNAVGHMVGGNMRGVVADVSNVRGRLRLVIAED